MFVMEGDGRSNGIAHTTNPIILHRPSSQLKNLWVWRKVRRNVIKKVSHRSAKRGNTNGKCFETRSMFTEVKEEKVNGLILPSDSLDRQRMRKAESYSQDYFKSSDLNLINESVGCTCGGMGRVEGDIL